MKLIFATGNRNKLVEIANGIPSHIELLSMRDMGFDGEIDETGTTLEENAKIKSDFIYELFNENCFADDTGLEIPSLGGAPGVYSARYAGEHCSFDDNMNLVLKNLTRSSDRSAWFRTVIHLHWNGAEHVFEGIIKGIITKEKSGRAGFGYDPIFKPEGYNKTFAEMNLSEKNGISHRGLAVKKMMEFLKSAS